MNTITHALFDCVKSVPNKIVLFEGGNPRYDWNRLWQKACNVAELLKKTLMSEGEAIVALSFPEFSADYVVAILAVWLSSSAFMPLVTTLPMKRWKFMLEESDASVLLYHPSLHSFWQLQELPSTTIALQFPEGEDSITREGSLAPPPPCDPTRLAYLIYTSGSTGIFPFLFDALPL